MAYTPKMIGLAKEEKERSPMVILSPSKRNGYSFFWLYFIEHPYLPDL